jgi:ABC-type Mn2+/Zn2+ transport system permease subunit
MIDAWSLFADAWLSSWCAAGLLGLLGVAVVAREQVFLGAAMAQAATAATALALFLGAGAASLAALHLETPLAIAAATAVAFVTGRGHRESAIALVFIGGSAMALLLVAQVPHGLQEVQRLTASSMVGASRVDTVVLAVACILLATAVLRWRAVLVTWLLDPAFAAAVGLRLPRLEALLAVVLGLSVGWTLQVGGLLFVLGGLVLPALAARSLARELGTALLLAPLLAVVLAVIGSTVSHFYDLPPAQSTVALWALIALLAATVGRWRTRGGTH